MMTREDLSGTQDFPRPMINGNIAGLLREADRRKINRSRIDYQLRLRDMEDLRNETKEQEEKTPSMK